jgi:hypothetical protein
MNGRDKNKLVITFTLSKTDVQNPEAILLGDLFDSGAAGESFELLRSKVPPGEEEEAFRILFDISLVREFFLDGFTLVGVWTGESRTVALERKNELIKSQVTTRQ